MIPGRSIEILAVLVLAGFLGFACSDSAQPVDAHEVSVTPPSLTTAVSAELGFLESVNQAPRRVCFGGTRRIEYHYEVGGVTQILVYSEHVTADGQGHFAIDPGAVEIPALTVPQREVFELIQKEREGFFYRYRDFSIRAATLFRANYTMQVLAATPVVAGRLCTELEVHRSDQARSSYLVDIDPETGLVMRYSEFGLAGELLARVEFTEFMLSPPLDGVAFFASRYPEVELDPAHESAGDIGFQPSTPRYVPAGYQLQHSEVLRAEGDTWVRRVFGDGLENLFFLQGRPNPGHALNAGSAPVVSGHPLRDASTTSAPETYVVRVCQVGPWTLAEVARGDEQIFVVGKIGEAEIVRVLQSGL